MHAESQVVRIQVGPFCLILLLVNLHIVESEYLAALPTFVQSSIEQTTELKPELIIDLDDEHGDAVTSSQKCLTLLTVNSGDNQFHLDLLATNGHAKKFLRVLIQHEKKIGPDIGKWKSLMVHRKNAENLFFIRLLSWSELEIVEPS